MRNIIATIATIAILLVFVVSCNSEDSELFNEVKHSISRAGNSSIPTEQENSFKIGWDYISIENGRYVFNMTPSKAEQLGISVSDYNIMTNSIAGANDFITKNGRQAEIKEMESIIYRDSASYADDLTTIDFDSISIENVPHSFQKMPGEISSGYYNNGQYIGYLTIWIPYGYSGVYIELSAMGFFNVYKCEFPGVNPPCWGCSGMYNGFGFDMYGLSPGTSYTIRITTYGGAPSVYFKYLW